MSNNDSFDSVRENFYQHIIRDSIGDEEIRAIIIEKGEQSLFFELCKHFVDISLNAKRIPLDNYELQGVFAEADIDCAVNEFVEFFTDNGLTNVEGLLETVKQMHLYAVEDNDSRIKSVRVGPRLDRDSRYAGKFFF